MDILFPCIYMGGWVKWNALFQPKEKRVFNCRAENVIKDVCVAQQGWRTLYWTVVLKEAGICTGKMCIWVQKPSNSPGACFASRGHRPGLLVSAKAEVSVCAKLATATELGPLQEEVFICTSSVPSGRSNKPSSPPFFLHPSTIPLPTPCQAFVFPSGDLVLPLLIWTVSQETEFHSLMLHVYVFEAQNRNHFFCVVILPGTDQARHRLDQVFEEEPFSEVTEAAEWRKGDTSLYAVCSFHGWCTLQAGTASYSRVLSIRHRCFLALPSANRERSGGKAPSFPLTFSVCRGSTKHFCCFGAGFADTTQIWEDHVQARQFPSKFSFTLPSVPITTWPKQAPKRSQHCQTKQHDVYAQMSLHNHCSVMIQKRESLKYYPTNFN